MINLQKVMFSWTWQHSNTGVLFFNNWGSGEPANSFEKNCALATIADHTWAAKSCSDAGSDAFIVCQIKDAGKWSFNH